MSMEKFNQFTATERPTLSERGLVTELSALRNDWFRANAVVLEGKTPTELKQAIENFYSETSPIINDILEEKGVTFESDIQQLARKHLNTADIQRVREELDLPKWVSLSEAVAFIKTTLDIQDEGVREKYAEYCAETFSLNDMRSTLAFENDVKPARIDTDIYHQTPERSRSAVEIVSNAIDAISSDGSSIGRFGVGFYQILAHLKTEHDFVEVKTGNEQDGFYNVGFRLKGEEIQVSLSENNDAPTKGTTVRLSSKDFPREEADALIKKHFTYNDVARVFCNGDLVNDLQKFGVDHREQAPIAYESTDEGFIVRDEGVGMSPQVILEKLLVPKFSGKRPVHELVKEESVTGSYLVERRTAETIHDQGTAIINVGGVLIEEVPLTGIHTPRTLVINLPAFTSLGEERNQVAIDEVTIKAVKGLIHKAIESNDYEILNSIAPVVETFQHRSLQHSKENNLLSYLQNEADVSLPKDVVCLPNVSGFDRLEVKNSILLDPSIKTTHWSHIPELSALNTVGNGKAIFIGPVTNDVERPIIEWGNQVIFDKDLYEKFKSDPTLINLYLGAHGKAEATETRKITAKQEIQENSVESREGAYRDINDFVEQNFTALNFDNINQARAYLKRYGATLNPELTQILLDIANKFPSNISSYFVGSALSGRMDEATIKASRDFATLGQNPELVSSLAIAGIRGLGMERIEQHPFPGIKNYTNDKSAFLVDHPELQQVSNQDWYSVEYWNRDNLIAEDGKVYQGEISTGGISMTDRKLLFGLLPIYNSDTKEITFFDPVTRTFSDKKFNSNDKHARAFTFGEKRLFVTERGIFDFDSGERLPLMTDEQVALHHSNENGILSRFGNKYLLPNGTVLTHSEFYNQIQPQHESELNPTKLVPFYRKDKVELRMGERAVFVKHREGSEKRDHNEDVFGNLVEVDGRNFVVAKYRSSTESQVCIVDVDGNTLLDITTSDSFKTKVLETPNGTKILCVKEYKEKNVHYGGSWHTETTFLNVRYFDFQGNELIDSELKDAPPFTLPANAYHYTEEVVKVTVSPYQSELWHVKIQEIGNGKDYKLQLIDSETNTPLSTEQFRSVVYDSTEDVWKCTLSEPVFTPTPTGDKYISDTEKEARSLYKVLVIDRNGDIIREEEEDIGGKINIQRMHILYGEGGRYLRNSEEEELKSLSTTELSYEKTVAINRAIHSFSQSDRDSVERLVSRSLNFGNLPDASFEKIVPVFAQVKYLDERLLTEERIENISARLQEFDESTSVWCFRFLSQMLHPRAQGGEVDSFTEKFLLVYREKIAQLPDTEKEQLYDAFAQLRDYSGEYLATGWTIVQHKSPIPISQVPEKIRAIVDFLRSDEKTNLTQSPERIVLNESRHTTLSKLIQTKRLNERAIQQFAGSADDLKKIVDEKTTGKNQEHIRREIIHPIYYQGVNNPYLFIRELIQNGHDVAVKSTDSTDKKITLDVFSRQEDEVTVRIEDRGGMKLQDVVNYFLIPGESTKIDSKEAIGYFGQGVFTLFRDAKEVMMQTSIGDGVVNKLRIAPQRNESGMIIDLDIQIEQEQGDFKGTTIEKTIATASPTVEGAFIKNAASTYAGLVDSNVVDISLNNQQLNSPQAKLAELEIPDLGSVAVYDAPNNVITQRGLFVKAIDSDFKTKMYDVEKLLEKRGVVISIPDSISLTRSRNDIARKQEFLPALQEYLPLLKLKAYLELFRQDIEKGHVIQLENLPYDYYYEQSDDVQNKILQDAQRLREGKPITDVRNYLERGKLVELLVHLPVVEFEDKTYSLHELRRSATRGGPPLQSGSNWDKIPKFLRDKLREGKEQYERHATDRRNDEESGRNVADFSLEAYEQQPEFVRTQIEKNLPAFQAMDVRIKTLNTSMSEFVPIFKDTTNSLYYESGQSLAHANPARNMLGWNLKNLSEYRVANFNKSDVSDASLQDFYEVYSHECAHLLEKSGEFTHNQQFYRQQARTLVFLMRAKQKEMS